MDSVDKRIDLLETPKARVRAGEPLEIRLPAIGATGNVWTVHTDSNRVQVLGHEKRPSETSFGGGGEEVFRLRPVGEGRSVVRFRLGAPWRKVSAEEHELQLDVFRSDEE